MRKIVALQNGGYAYLESISVIHGKAELWSPIVEAEIGNTESIEICLLLDYYVEPECGQCELKLDLTTNADKTNSKENSIGTFSVILYISCK